MDKYDFSGWATKNDLRCSDGRIIRRNAFEDDNGITVPLVWNHLHNDPDNVLGHALLENRDEGVYAYCTLNNTATGKTARELVKHGDVKALSIYANGLRQKGSDVLHGAIKEVSLVLAGANPGATIESILVHGELSDEECIFQWVGDDSIAHAESTKEEKMAETKEQSKEAEDDKKNEEKDETVKDVFDTLSEKQKKVVYALIGAAVEDAKNGKDEEEETKEVKHNVFDVDETHSAEVLSHSEQEAIFADAKRYGSLKDSILAHGIDDIDYLFPDAKNVTNTPEFIKRPDSWVSKVMGAVHHTPFSRIKSMFADITEDDARAKGYIKGNMKKEEVFGLLKRTTTPTTVYKKQKLDRDDIIDITDFDVVSWLKTEMRGMLDEELARAFLIGDGRTASSDDKINEQNIRPIATDDDLYTIKKTLSVASGASDDDVAKDFIKTIVKARKDYKGSGNPVLYTTEDMLTNCLLLEDTMGRRLYNNEADVAAAMRVSSIITVPVMENATGANGGTLIGIVVNLTDYNVGADKGGAVSMFDDFDIDYNAQKYLIETRCSGALIKPYSAIAIETATTTAEG